MNRLAKVLRARRSERGALQLASPEVKFKIDDETTDPMDVGMYQVGPAASMGMGLGLICTFDRTIAGVHPIGMYHRWGLILHGLDFRVLSGLIL
jgi:hypothetical protein